jgi:hypothetical protein
MNIFYLYTCWYLTSLFILKYAKITDEATGSSMPQNVPSILVDYNTCQISSVVNAMKEAKVFHVSH